MSTRTRGRVALVSQWFLPEPITVPVWLARSLHRADWTVDVLTGIPNFPDGRVMAGYSAWRGGVENLDAFAVHRTPLYPNHGRSPIKRVANYLSWAGSAAVAGQRLLRHVDVSLVYSSPATAALPAMEARRRFGVPYVLMIQDVWPDSIFASGFLQEGRLRRYAETGVGRFAMAAYSHAHAIAVISPGMRELLIERGVPAEKIELVYNWVDEKVFRPADPDPALRPALGLGPDDFLFMYAGNHGGAQDLSNVLNAMALLSDRASHIHLAMIGSGIEREHLRRSAQDRGLKRVHFLDARPINEMTPLVAAADAHLVSLADHDLFRITMPSKVQSLMASGKPIVVSAPGDAAGVVEQSASGVSVPPADPAALAGALLQMAAQPVADRNAMGAAGLAAYRTQMCEAVGVAKLTGMLESAIQERSGS